jgi:hypothetical protein
MTAGGGGYLDRPGSSSLADVVETLLDKGIVIDVYARVSLLGIELVTLDAGVVVASVDSYLRFAEAVNRLDLADKQIQGVSGLIEDTAEAVVAGTITGVKEGVKDGASEVLDEAKDAVGEALGEAKDAASDALGDVKDAAKEKLGDLLQPSED